MKAAKVQKNGRTFDVVDTRTGKTVRRNLKGCKAAAYVEYYNEQVAKSEAAFR